jgi:hypothetical protein
MAHTRAAHDLLVMIGYTAVSTAVIVTAIVLLFRRGKRITDL